MAKKRPGKAKDKIVWGVGKMERLAGCLELPHASLANLSRMELHGNSQVMVEGCGGILEYQTEVIRVKTGKMVTKFTGRGLKIRCMTEDSLVVEGFLTDISFLL